MRNGHKGMMSVSSHVTTKERKMVMHGRRARRAMVFISEVIFFDKTTMFEVIKLWRIKILKQIKIVPICVVFCIYLLYSYHPVMRLLNSSDHEFNCGH